MKYRPHPHTHVEPKKKWEWGHVKGNQGGTVNKEE